MKLSIEELKELLPGFHLDHRGKNLRGPCPQCNHDEFGISIEEGHKFGCHRKIKCGFNGNIITLLRFLGKYDEYRNQKATTLPSKIGEVLEEVTEADLDLATITPPMGWRRVFDHPYLNQRGFTEQTYHDYPVGVTMIEPRLKKDYIIFLCIQYQEVKGWVARHIKTKEELEKINFIRKGQNKPFLPRYKNSFSDFGKMCYGLDELNQNTKRLILVEGIFDKIGTDKGLKLRGKDIQKCICTYKAGLSDEQLESIKQKAPNLEEVVLLYDGDVVKIVKETAPRLEQEGYEVKVGYHSTKDPGDMSESDFFEVFSTLQSPIEFKSFKLEVNKLK